MTKKKITQTPAKAVPSGVDIVPLVDMESVPPRTKHSTWSQVITAFGFLSSADLSGFATEDYVDTALTAKQDAGDYAHLVGGKVPAAELPSYVDDILEYANLAAFPVTGETGKIYLALNTNRTYRWSGSVYAETSPGLVTSVAGRTGDVILVAADITDFAAAVAATPPASHAHGSIANDGTWTPLNSGGPPTSTYSFLKARHGTGTLSAVQTVDWYNDISNVPSEFPPSAHASSHATAGGDPIAPSDIGAATDSHTHGNLTNDGKLNTSAPGIVVTDNDGFIDSRQYLAASLVAPGAGSGQVPVTNGSDGFAYETPTSTPTISAIVRYDGTADVCTNGALRFSNGGIISNAATTNREWTLPDVDGTVALTVGGVHATNLFTSIQLNNAAPYTTTILHHPMPTAARTITLPDADGTVVLDDGTGSAGRAGDIAMADGKGLVWPDTGLIAYITANTLGYDSLPSIQVGNVDYFVSQVPVVITNGYALRFDNGFRTDIVAAQTADRTITLPDASGTVVVADGSGIITSPGLSGIITGDNVTFAMGGNTLDAYSSGASGATWILPNASGTVVLSDATGYISGATYAWTDGLILSDGSYDTTLQSSATANRTIDLPDASGTVMLVGDAPTAHGASHAIDGSDPVPRIIVTPSQITSNQNDYATGDGDFFRISSDAARDITGIVAAAGGHIIRLVNVGSFAITLKHNSGSSSAANRINVPWAGDAVISAGDTLSLWYDDVSTVWRVM